MSGGVRLSGGVPADLARSEPRKVHPGPFELAEGPFWHPGRDRLFFHSILDGRLIACDLAGTPAREWHLGERASASAIVDRDTLLMATESGLHLFDLEADGGAGRKALIEPVEADNRLTRSNDGRAAPDGTFWFSTMGHEGEDGAGAIYRYAPGRKPPVSSIARRITIPNAIAFSPQNDWAFRTDSVTSVIMRMPLDPQTGDPAGEAEPHIDLRERGWSPDGAVVDEDGALWCAIWGAGLVARFDPDGALMGAVAVPASQPTCPAFGGPDMRTLFVTTATQDLPADADDPHAGAVFAVETDVRGRPEPRVATIPGAPERCA